MEVKRLSVTEFDRMAKQIAPVVYVYDSDNQSWFDDSPGKIVAKYNRVVCMLNPNSVCFVGHDGTLCLDDVQEVLCESEGGIYMKLEIKCRNLTDAKRDVSYVILVDRRQNM